MSYVSVKNIGKKYGDRIILERVNLEVDEGEFVSIVGASGCGKSTFLRLLLAQEVPTSGVISVANEKAAVEPEKSRGIVFQRYSVFPHKSVRDNLISAKSFAKPLGRLSKSERKEALDEANESLNRIGLSHVADAYPSALSGGMQQRLAIAQAMLAKPKILLLDEPFGALDPGTKQSMHGFLNELHAKTNMTVFMVTHDLQEGFELGSRLIVFDKVRWDPQFPDAYGATITYDLDTSKRQNLKKIDKIMEEHNVTV